MVELTPPERAIVDELIECIAEAMARIEDVDPAYANKTKIQKLLFLAIDEFDLPVTYSWYLAGAVLPGDRTTVTQLETAFDELPGTDGPTIPGPEDVTEDENVAEGEDENEAEDTPSVADERGAADHEDASESAADARKDASESASDGILDDFAPSASSVESGVDPILFSGDESDASDAPHDADRPAGGLDDRRSEVISFYVSALPDVWHQNTMRFLQNFYLEYAPLAYRDLYVQSTRFRTRLREIEAAVDDRLRGDQPSQPIPDLVKAAQLEVSDMHCTIRSSETLAGTFEDFVRGTDAIEDGLMMLADRAPDELERDHLAAVRSMQEFYYYYVWRYPCLVISRETARGPSAESLRASRRREFEAFDAELADETAQFERELADAGLKPAYGDYPSNDDEFGDAAAALTEQYFEQ